MGVINVTTDSFSDTQRISNVSDGVRRAVQLFEDGADILDIGGMSNVTNRPAISAEEEAERVAPLVARLALETSALISVDTYRPVVAAAAIEAGAHIINDISGLADEHLALICASSGAALVIMHTRVAPKQKLHDEGLYNDDVGGDVLSFLKQRIDRAVQLGMDREQIIVDPGPDFSKTPAQTVDALRGIDKLQPLQRPILMAISRKDFIGAITSRRPTERLAGTLAALADGVERGGHIFRLHDVREAADYLTVRAHLSGKRTTPPGLRVPEDLRREPAEAPPVA